MGYAMGVVEVFDSNYSSIESALYELNLNVNAGTYYAGAIIAEYPMYWQYTLDVKFERENGALQVTIDPPAAVSAGAQWRITGDTTWRNSGATQTGIDVGSHTVEFQSISNWAKPSNQTITITKDQTTQESATYTQQTGALKVTSFRNGAIDDDRRHGFRYGGCCHIPER